MRTHSPVLDVLVAAVLRAAAAEAGEEADVVAAVFRELLHRLGRTVPDLEGKSQSVTDAHHFSIYRVVNLVAENCLLTSN